MLEPEAVTIRPDMGSAQLEQDTAGIEWRWSHGSRDDGALFMEDVEAEGVVAACRGKGRGGCFASTGKLMAGTEVSLSPFTSIVGVGETPSGRLMVGRAVIDAEDGSSSGKLMVGTTGADTVTSGIVCAGLGKGLSLDFSTVGDSVSLMTGLSMSWLVLGESLGGFHKGSKLTIGRPH